MSIFIISCCHFQHTLSTRKAFNSNLILNLWNVLNATLLPSVVAPTTLETKKIPTDLLVGLETSSDAEASSVAPSASVSTHSSSPATPYQGSCSKV